MKTINELEVYEIDGVILLAKNESSSSLIGTWTIGLF